MKFHNNEIHNNERTPTTAGQMWPFSKKMMALFKSLGAKKVVKKSKMGKKHELMTNTVWPSIKKLYNFYIFGPPTTKGWRRLI